MKLVLLASVIIFGSLAANAANDHCSSWSKVRGVTCIFNGDDASFWKRTCTDENLKCKDPDYYTTPCDAEEICVDKKINPNLITTVCTDWVLDDSVTCVDDGDSTKVWRRACQMAWVPTSACQNAKPDND
jgi:hypothetical protein